MFLHHFWIHQRKKYLGNFHPLRTFSCGSFVQTYFKVKSLSDNDEQISSAIYLQVSIISQALIFVTRSQSWSFTERPGTLLMCAFVVAQLVRPPEVPLYIVITSELVN